MRVCDGFDEAEIPTAFEIRYGLILFGLTFVYGGLLALVVLAQIAP